MTERLNAENVYIYCKEKNVARTSSSTRIKPLATAVTQGQCSLGGIQDEENQEAFCALDILALDKITYLRKNLSDPRFLHLPIQGKAPKPFAQVVHSL